MSDVSDGSGQVPRRVPRSTDGGAPVSGALAIVLAVVAVLAGFLILRSISGDDEQQLDIPADGRGSTSATDAPGDSVASTPASSLPVQTTEAPLVKEGATVIVANASGIGGSAASMTTALELEGFTMGEPTNKSASLPQLDTTQIYFDPAQPVAQQVADAVNRTLGGDVVPTPLSGTPPVESGNMNGAGVLVMLGRDKAGKSVADLNPTADTAVPTVTNPSLTGTTAPAG